MFNLSDLPLTEDGGLARMPKDEGVFQTAVPKSEYVPVAEMDLWFLDVLEPREKAVVEQAYHYQAMNAPGLPGHLYLTTIHKLAEILAQVDVEFEEEAA